MARQLKTKSGRAKRRKHVKLDKRGISKLEGILGTGKTRGVEFSLGIFRNNDAKFKGYMLEFGRQDGHQPARPWLSSALAKGNPTRGKILRQITRFVSDAIAGKDSKESTRRELLKIFQMHLLGQDFGPGTVKPLSESTVRQKRAKGSKNPEDIGLDTFRMSQFLDVKVRGNLNRSIRGK